MPGFRGGPRGDLPVLRGASVTLAKGFESSAPYRTNHALHDPPRLFGTPSPNRVKQTGLRKDPYVESPERFWGVSHPEPSWQDKATPRLTPGGPLRTTRIQCNDHVIVRPAPWPVEPARRGGNRDLLPLLHLSRRVPPRNLLLL